MRSRCTFGFILLAALLAGTGFASGQTAPQLQRGPDSNSSTHVPGIDILPLTGLPFSGVDKIVWTRPTVDGGTVTVSLEAKAVRDSQGRLYRERHSFSAANLDPGKTLEDFTISDPVTHLRIHCVKKTHWCQVTKYRAPLVAAVQPKPQPVGPFDQGRRYLTRENLGTRDIEGLSATGTLETTTIAAGTLGNNQPMTLSREIWYSPDLKNNLAVTRKDPRGGTQAITLTILSRDEPDESIFSVPAEYGLVDDRGVVMRQPQPQTAPQPK